ncbi:MAG: polymer-forming cytoskeletal protein [Chthoniobacterales bacterium]
MFGGIRKIPTTCPHCGFVQDEPSALIATYCRGCGDHYSVAKSPDPNGASAPAPADAIATAPHPRGRVIHCEECGHDHEVSRHLRASLCPECGHETELADIRISSHRTRSVDTRGTVHVTRSGFLNCTHTRCGSARIEGRFAGRIDCTGTLRIRGEGTSRSRIEAHTLVIDRGSDLRFAFPIRAEEIVLRGRVEADIFCPGTIRIGRHGALDGNVHARSLVVDKGGDYQGSLEVATTIIDNYPRSGTIRPPEVKVLSAWGTVFA